VRPDLGAATTGVFTIHQVDRTEDAGTGLALVALVPAFFKRQRSAGVERRLRCVAGRLRLRTG
jgi:hypothetical protein